MNVNLVRGLYFVTLTNKEGSVSKKFIYWYFISFLLFFCYGYSIQK
jgi:hypothetical protein